ncbi:Ribosome biogenesis protein BOP1-like protein [Bienertia sinuspersici]
MKLKVTKKPTMATTKKNDKKKKEKQKIAKEKRTSDKKEERRNKKLLKSNKKEKVRDRLKKIDLRDEEDENAQSSDYKEASEPDSPGRGIPKGDAPSNSTIEAPNYNDAHTSGNDDDESYFSVEESDSSEDEVAPRNTIGDVPLEFYKDEEHIGYDVKGRKIKKKGRTDNIANFLKINDELNDEEVELSRKEIKIIRRIAEGKTPHADVDPYAPYVDWFDWDGKGHPLSNAPEPKRRFIPSKSEAKKISKYVRAIREGRIKFDKPKEEPKVYLLWGDDSSSSEKTRGLYTSLRGVPAYENYLKECFNRLLDLYLCPRARKKRLNVTLESLKPKRVDPKDLKPYPTTCYVEYKGHNGAVVSISTESTGQWIASGSIDGTVRIWEVATGRCVRVWEVGSAVRHVAWNPLPNQPILAVSVDQDVLILDTGLGSEEEQRKISDLLQFEKPAIPDESGDADIVSWHSDDKLGGLRLKHFKTVSSIEWHRRGDYFSTLSKKGSQRIPFKLHGLPISTTFHPSRSIFFIATKKNVRVYDLLKEKLIKKLDTKLREVSSMAVHPGGDNVIVGSREGKLCWFDMDLSSTPYKTLKYHTKDITNVAFHRSYPLFASCSEDGKAYVFHGMVYSDLNQDPLIVPVRILQGHCISNRNVAGVLDCKFHPRQPWLFTAGADSVIKLFCH